MDAAALLHDLGRIVGCGSRQKHPQTLIEYSGLPGFSPPESALIALLTRYHRKGDPDISDYDLPLDDDTMLLIRLAAILRVAECLERGRNADIDDVIATWSDHQLRFTLISNEYPAVELWQAERNAAQLMEDAFGREVSFDSPTPPLEWSEAEPAPSDGLPLNQ